MRASHTAGGVSARFDDRNVVSSAGLVPVMRLAHAAGLGELAGRVRLGSSPGRRAAEANPQVKIASLVAGMVAGADSIQDMNLLRHGALPQVFDGARSASTMGTFLRHFTPGHVAQLENVALEVLQNLAGLTPLLPDSDGPVFVDVDSKIAPVYGQGKTGAAFGHTHTLGYNLLTATLSVARSALLSAA